MKMGGVARYGQKVVVDLLLVQVVFNSICHRSRRRVREAADRFRILLRLTSCKLRQQIKDEDALPIIAGRCDASKKDYCPKRYIGDATQIENYFCR